MRLRGDAELLGAERLDALLRDERSGRLRKPMGAGSDTHVLTNSEPPSLKTVFDTPPVFL